MEKYKMPELPKELLARIKLVRRDVGDLLFHFTRGREGQSLTWKTSLASEITDEATAYNVLRKILAEGAIQGSSGWTYGKNCVCFTEAPITEFNSIFSLVSIAASQEQRPRYEPYGIAVNKSWLFQQGGRPVIYDEPGLLEVLPERLKYRFTPYDPAEGIDFTWEREWRINADSLSLDPNNSLVVVPTATEAFEITYDFANIEADIEVEGSGGEPYFTGAYHVPRWLAVSLDVFGLKFTTSEDV